MKLLADMHISPGTVEFLRGLGHDVRRVNEVLSATASDQVIVACALEQGRVILTQDLDFTDIIALSGATAPSLISLRLSISRVERVNEALRRVLPEVEEEVRRGAIITVKDGSIKRRWLPVS